MRNIVVDVFDECYCRIFFKLLKSCFGIEVVIVSVNEGGVKVLKFLKVVNYNGIMKSLGNVKY